MHALFDPVDALFAVRDEHTQLFKHELAADLMAVDGARHIYGYVEKAYKNGVIEINDLSGNLEGRPDTMMTIALSETSPIILGWMLSPYSTREIDEQLSRREAGQCVVSPFTPSGYRFERPAQLGPPFDIVNDCIFQMLRDQLGPREFHMPRIPEVDY